MKFSDIHLKEAFRILRYCGLVRPLTIGLLIAFYILSILHSCFEGFGFFLLVKLVTGNIDTGSHTAAGWIVDAAQGMVSGEPYRILYFTVIGLFLFKVTVEFAMTIMDGVVESITRRKIQECGYASLVRGDWEYLRDIRIGQKVGAITEEGTHVAVYFLSLIKISYTFIGVVLLAVIAFQISAEISLVFTLIGIPIMMVLKYFFGRQARVAGALVAERQGFYTNITERLQHLFQIKAEGELDHHIQLGIRNQQRLTRLQIIWWLLQGMIQNINNLLPAVVLLVFYFWSIYRGEPISQVLTLIAGVGIIGSRALNRVTTLNASIGALTGYAGSILPVYRLFTTPPAAVRAKIEEKITGVQVEKVQYRFDTKKKRRFHKADFVLGRHRQPSFFHWPFGSRQNHTRQPCGRGHFSGAGDGPVFWRLRQNLCCGPVPGAHQLRHPGYPIAARYHP
jgi:ABC-type multidrug transport system fused ATPase/permease subunit